MTLRSAERVKVVHFVDKWLPQASAWLYNQIRFLPSDEVENHIVCNETGALDQFPHPHIWSLEAFPSMRKRSGVEVGLWFLSQEHPRKLGMPEFLNSVAALSRCVNFPTL